MDLSVKLTKTAFPSTLSKGTRISPTWTLSATPSTNTSNGWKKVIATLSKLKMTLKVAKKKILKVSLAKYHNLSKSLQWFFQSKFTQRKNKLRNSKSSKKLWTKTYLKSSMIFHRSLIRYWESCRSFRMIRAKFKRRKKNWKRWFRKWARKSLSLRSKISMKH
mgnify:CR=1 FL=1